MDGLGIAGPLRHGANRTLDRPGTIIAVALIGVIQNIVVNAVPQLPMDPGGTIKNSLVSGFFDTLKTNTING